MSEKVQTAYPLRIPRTDGKPGHCIVVETVSSHFRRAYVMPDKRGADPERTFLLDRLGAKFVDNLGYDDKED